MHTTSKVSPCGYDGAFFICNAPDYIAYIRVRCDDQFIETYRAGDPVLMIRMRTRNGAYTHLAKAP